MIEQKQEYQRPVVEVLVVENNDIICSSGEQQMSIPEAGFNNLTPGGDI